MSATAEGAVRQLPELLTLAEIAEVLRVHPRTVSRLLDAGKFPAPDFNPGSSHLRRWRRETVERALAGRAA